MAFAAEVTDFINAFGAMQKILGTKSSRESERALTDYRRAAADKLRWDMGETDRITGDVLSYADRRYPAFNSDEITGGANNDEMIGGINSGNPFVIDGVTFTGNFKGIDPAMYPIIRGIAAGAKRAGVSQLNMTGGYEGGHKSHLSRNDLDFSGAGLNDQQKDLIFRGAAAGGALRFGKYPGGSIHIGRAGAYNPRTGQRTPAAVWGAGGATSRAAGGRNFNDPYMKAFIRDFDARDLADAMSGESSATAIGGGAADDLEAIHTAGPLSRLSQYRDAIASVESQGSGDYGAVNKSSGALGRYQVMPQYLPEWSKDAFGRVVSPEEFLRDPKLQDQLFDNRFRGYLLKYGNPRDAISAWFTGRPEAVAGANETDGGIRNKEYIDKVMNSLGLNYTGRNVGPTPSDNAQFDELQAVLATAGQEELSTFPDDTALPPDEREKDDLATILAAPDTKIPWYNRGAYGSDVYDDLSTMRSIQEAIETSPIMALPQDTITVGRQAGLSSPPVPGLRTKDDILIGGRPPPLPPIPEPPARPKDDLLIEGREPGTVGPPRVTNQGILSPAWMGRIEAAGVPLPPPRPETGPTEPVAGEDMPLPPLRPSGAIDETPRGGGVDPLPQTTGFTDPVAAAGHDSLSSVIQGGGNRRRQNYPGLLKRIVAAGKDMLGVTDTGIDEGGDDPAKDAYLTGVGGINARLIDQIEDRIEASNPGISEEQKRMEVVSTLWNYFAERGDYDKADKLAYAAMASYKDFSSRYAAIAQAALEDGDIADAIENYMAALSMVPDGEITEVIQLQDGHYQVTVTEADGDVVSQTLKTPRELVTDIMDMTPETFENMIERKINGGDTAAERAAQEETDWLTTGGGLPTRADYEGVNGADLAIPTPPPRPGMTGTGGSDTLEDEAIPETTDETVVAEGEGFDIRPEVDDAMSEIEDARGMPFSEAARASAEKIVVDNTVRAYAEAGDTRQLTLDGAPIGGPNVTSDVTIKGGGDDEAIRETVTKEAPAEGFTPEEPPEAMTPEQFTSYLAGIPAGARGLATELWKIQDTARRKWEEDQPTPADIAADKAVSQFFAELEATPFFDPETDQPIYYNPDDRMLGLVGTERGNLMLSASKARNDQLDKLVASRKEGTQQTAFAEAMGTVADIPNTPAGITPASAPIGPDAGNMQVGSPEERGLKPGSITPDQLRRPVQGLEPQRKAIPEFATELTPFMSNEQLSQYTKRHGEVVTERQDWNKEFDTQGRVDVSKIADPTGAGDTLPLSTIFIGEGGAEDVTPVRPGDEGGGGGLLGEYIANQAGTNTPKNMAAAEMLSSTQQNYPNFAGNIATAATDILYASGRGAEPRTAFDTVTDMLWVDKDNPLKMTYVATAIPDQPGMVKVHILSDPPSEVNMPMDTYENLDYWRSVIQTDYMNKVANDRAVQQAIDIERTNADEAFKQQILKSAETLPEAEGQPAEQFMPGIVVPGQRLPPAIMEDLQLEMERQGLTR